MQLHQTKELRLSLVLISIFSSGAVSVKSGGITNAQLAGSIANDKLLAIAQSKVTGLTTALSAKIESLSDLSITASAAEINILDGVTGVSAAEISHLDGVTSSIQTQLNAKQAAGSYLSTSSSISDLVRCKWIRYKSDEYRWT